MIVIIDDNVFASSVAQLELLSLLHLGFEGRHRIQTDPLYETGGNQALNRWLDGLPETQRDEVVLALESGIEEDASGILPDLAVRVGLYQQPDWDAKPALLPLPLALRFLRRPLRLLLENQHNDAAFLKAIAPKPWRRRYLDLLEARAIEIDHGGGLSDMKTRVNQTANEEALRLWALFDSDSREPGLPSDRSEFLRQSCENRGIAHHQLRRRFIESYLPVKAIVAWADLSSGNVRRARRKSAEAFAEMKDQQRHHYNMKGGFQADRLHGIPAFYEYHADNPHLQRGFGDSIANLFHGENFQIQEEWLVRDGQQEEASKILQSIFRRL